MNRISSFEKTSGQPNICALDGSLAEMSRAHTSISRGVCHSVFVPLHYEPNYAYPLVVWLHGPGTDERQLKEIVPYLSLRNYVAVAPRGTRAETESDSHHLGYTWGQRADDILLAQQRVLDCVELAIGSFNIAPNRVFLAGDESGGTMALRIGLACAEKFAGVVSLGGAFPVGNNPLVRVEEARRLPLLLAHGRASMSYGEDEVCRDLRLIHSAGISVTLRQYPGGDEVSAQMLRDVDAWIMQHVTGNTIDSGDSMHRRYVDLN